MWFDLQIDLETMGLPPTGAIVSIGACFFDLDTCTVGPTFNKVINLATAVRDGGTIDPSTLMWWLRQGDEARRSISVDDYDIRQVLAEFTAFIEQHSTIPDVRPWGNSSSFDLTILGGAYKRAGLQTPWRFGKERCFRTVRCMYPSIEYNPDDKGSENHNALSDAIFQARHLFKIKNRNKPSA